MNDEIVNNKNKRRSFSISLVKQNSSPPPRRWSYKDKLLFSKSENLKKSEIENTVCTTNHQTKSDDKVNDVALEKNDISKQTGCPLSNNKSYIPDFYKPIDSNKPIEYNYLLDSIRNMRKLNEDQIQYLDSLTVFDLKQFIIEYDKVVYTFITLLDDGNTNEPSKP